MEVSEESEPAAEILPWQRAEPELRVDVWDQVSDKPSLHFAGRCFECGLGLRVEARVEPACVEARVRTEVHVDGARAETGVREDPRDEGREKHSVASDILD